LLLPFLSDAFCCCWLLLPFFGLTNDNSCAVSFCKERVPVERKEGDDKIR
jgi:hypothetical protein